LLKRWKGRHKSYPSISNPVTVGLFGNGLHGASSDAGSAIDASAFITLGLSIYHIKCGYGANVNASAAANAGFFINLNCHGVSP
jgi:hypothetical protein